MATIGYIRVSTIDQNIDLQRNALTSANCDRIFEDRISGKIANRPGLKRALKGTVAKLAMRQPFVLFKGLTFQKLCLPGAFRPGDHHNKMLRPG
ncbi:recombinase family protein, partial [Salmonella enterica]